MTATMLALGLLAVSTAAPAPVPPALSALIAAARLDSPVVAWCTGEFRSGRSGAYAVALAAGTSGGRYVIVEADATVTELAPFAGGADLACYSPADARRLDRSIRGSETIHGRVAPVSKTTVVCGFVEDTRAVCWQHSPSRGAFVKVGEWLT